MFIPKRIIFEKNAIDYEIGYNIYQFFKDRKEVEFIEMKGNRIKGHIPGDNLREYYKEGKNTLVVGVKKKIDFQSCKPSANYQLPLLSGCVGQCQYCYLNTNLSEKPYIKVNVNIDDIFMWANDYIEARKPEKTIFEGSATSDPVPVEPYTNILKSAIEFFSKSESGRFRFVTKFTDIDTLLDIEHNGHTEVRFSLNTEKIINEYEKRTPSLEKRLEASRKIIESGYPMGFLIAPVFLYDNWQKDYKELLFKMKESIPEKTAYPITFEIISHRYTAKAKSTISEIFPENTLPMNDEERVCKFGQFGYKKFMYKNDEINEMKEFFIKEIESIFDDNVIKYII